MPSSIQVHQGASDNPASAANNSVEQLQPSWCSRSTPLVQPLQWKLQLLGQVRHRLPGPAFLLAACDSLVLDTSFLVALGLLCPWWYHNTQQWPRKCYVVQTNPHSWIGFACSCAVREHPFAWPQLVCWMMPSCGIVVQSCYELWLLCLVQLSQEGLPNGPRQPCQERSLTWPAWFWEWTDSATSVHFWTLLGVVEILVSLHWSTVHSPISLICDLRMIFSILHYLWSYRVIL